MLMLKSMGYLLRGSDEGNRALNLKMKSFFDDHTKLKY
jgi:hypothetical protein